MWYKIQLFWFTFDEKWCYVYSRLQHRNFLYSAHFYSTGYSALTVEYRQFTSFWKDLSSLFTDTEWLTFVNIPHFQIIFLMDLSLKILLAESELLHVLGFKMTSFPRPILFYWKIKGFPNSFEWLSRKHNLCCIKTPKTNQKFWFKTPWTMIERPVWSTGRFSVRIFCFVNDIFIFQLITDPDISGFILCNGEVRWVSMIAYHKI